MLTGHALVFVARYLRRFFDFDSTPWAILHEWHQRLPAALTRAFAGIALIGIAPIRFDFEAGAIAPRAIRPI